MGFCWHNHKLAANNMTYALNEVILYDVIYFKSISIKGTIWVVTFFKIPILEGWTSLFSTPIYLLSCFTEITKTTPQKTSQRITTTVSFHCPLPTPPHQHTRTEHHMILDISLPLSTPTLLYNLNCGSVSGKCPTFLVNRDMVLIWKEFVID